MKPPVFATVGLFGGRHGQGREATSRETLVRVLKNTAISVRSCTVAKTGRRAVSVPVRTPSTVRVIVTGPLIN